LANRDQHTVGEKRIITWKWGNNPTRDEYTTSRAYIFGNYGDNYAHYARLVKEAKRDFPRLRNRDITVSVVRESTYMKNFIYISWLVKPNQQKEGYEKWGRFDFS
jgi:hypothetical protein